MKYVKPNLSVLFGDHVQVWLFIAPNWWFGDLVVIIIIELHFFNFVRNLKPIQKIVFTTLKSMYEGDTEHNKNDYNGNDTLLRQSPKYTLQEYTHVFNNLVFWQHLQEQNAVVM